MTEPVPTAGGISDEPRLTRGCRRVLEVLQQADNLTSAQDIYGLLRSSSESPGLTTVYRSLDTLVARGLVQCVDLGDGEKRYEAVAPGEHHHHLVCQGCGSSVHLEDCVIEDLAKSIKSRYGFVVSSHVLELFGLCGNCAESESPVR